MKPKSRQETWDARIEIGESFMEALRQGGTFWVDSHEWDHFDDRDELRILSSRNADGHFVRVTLEFYAPTSNQEGEPK